MFAKKSISRIFSILFIMMFMLSVAPPKAVQAAGVRYARPAPSGSGDCSSWGNACILQDSLTGAVSGEEIWAAAGTYKPGIFRSDTFQLKNGVAVYGGFAGTESLRSQRNPMANLTVLSGDIDNNDSQTPVITDLTTVSGNTNNTFRVVTGVSGATLDGFTITAGNANGDAPYDKGAGMYNSSSSPTLTNVTFTGNAASYRGAGMFNFSSSPVLTSVTFNANATAGNGGGIFNESGSSPTLTNVTLSSNSANKGGALYNSGSSPIMKNVTFAGNAAVDHGGGMFIADLSYPQFYNTIFWGNTAAAGIGAQIYAFSGGTLASDNIVQGGCADSSWTCGTNTLTADPNLGALGENGGFTQTIPLLAGSSAINTGNPTYNCPAADQRGVARLGTCDMGAFEYTGVDYVSVRYAKPAASGSGDCSSWGNACTLQSALTGSAYGQEIWAAAGTYKPGTFRSDTFQLKNGVAVYGGFAGTETLRSQRDPMANLTVLSGDIDNNDSQTPVITDLTTVSGNTNNTFRVVTGATASIVATLDGFTITAGNANGDAPYDKGAGMYNSSSSPTLTNVTFTGNAASYRGAGMFNFSSSPVLTSVTFNANATAGNGGGIFNESGSSPTLTNVTLSSNSANKGGALYNSGSSPIMKNVTFAGNAAVDHGGGMFIADLSYPQFYNTIFWGNTAAAGIGAQIYAFSGGTLASDNIVQGGCADSSWTCGTNTLTADPNLGALGENGGFTQTIPLLAGSSAINTGNPTYNCPAADQRGVARLGTCDMGAFEYTGVDYVSVRYAKPAASGSGDCSSWGNACTLQSALTGSAYGQEIWAAAGTYKPGTFRSDTFQLKNGVAVYGGFAGTETLRSQRDPMANLTVLSGDIDNNDSQTPIITDLTTVSGNTTNSFRVVTGATASIVATLDGFTITAGNANGDAPYDKGAGMYNSSSSPTLTNVTFTGNAASYRGAGMFNYASSPTLMNVTFNANATAGDGGGIYNESDSSPTLTNVTLSSNSANKGGALYNTASAPVMKNVTIAGNSAVDHGGGMYIANISNPQFYNTIFWGNTAAAGIGAQIYAFSGGTLASDNIVQGGCADSSWTCGTNTLTADPNLGALGKHGGLTQTIPLLAGSSAINTGNPTYCPAADQRGVARPQGAHCDIGAFEQDDFTSPTVVSSVRANANPTSAPSVNFTVTFSESVTGVDASDFSLAITGISGAVVTGVSGSGSVYTVTVNTGFGNGSIRLDVLASGVTITDLAGNPLANLPYTGGQTYSVNKNYLVYLPFIRR